MLADEINRIALRQKDVVKKTVLLIKMAKLLMDRLQKISRELFPFKDGLNEVVTKQLSHRVLLDALGLFDTAFLFNDVKDGAKMALLYSLAEG